MKKRVLVVGGGPGGYVAAIRAAQLGASVTVIERARPGGTCLNVGCIPTKVLLHAAELYTAIREEGPTIGIYADTPRFDWGVILKRKQDVVDYMVEGVAGLLKANGVTLISGTARLAGPRALEVEGRRLEADAIIVASGSEPSMPPVPGLDLPGILTSDGALSLESLPRSIAIAGGGVIGVEFASVFAAFGVEVTIVEMLPQILPNVDAEIAGILRKSIEGRGVSIYTGARLGRVARDGNGYVLEVDAGGEMKRLSAERVLVATGRRPVTRGLGLEEIGVEVQRGRVVTNARMETCVPGVYAVGDCTSPIMLAHVAEREGEVAAENTLLEDGHKVHMDYKTVPSAIYTSPAVASVGLSEEEARKRGHKVQVGRFPLAGNGKSIITNDAAGMVKIVSDEQYDEVLGVHMVGGPATDMIAEGGLALRLEATLEELISTIHPHPTVSEAFPEAAMATWGQAIHFPPE